MNDISPDALDKVHLEFHMNKISTRARIETFFEYLFSSELYNNKQCDCDDRCAKDLMLEEILKLLGAKSGRCRLFEFADGAFHQTIGPCTNGMEPEKAEAYWQEFYNEVASLIDE